MINTNYKFTKNLFTESIMNEKKPKIKENQIEISKN